MARKMRVNEMGWFSRILGRMMALWRQVIDELGEIIDELGKSYR